MSAAENMPVKGFEVFKEDGLYRIQVRRSFSPQDIVALEKEVFDDQNSMKVNFVIACKSIGIMSPPLTRFLVQLSMRLRTHGKMLRLLDLDEGNVENLKRQGVNSVLVCSPSLSAAKKEFGMIKGGTLDVNFINPFLDATINVLRIQTSTEARPGPISRKSSRDRLLGDVSGVIGIVSPVFTGSVVISFPESTFLKVMSRMLGEEFQAMTKEIEDGAGELTNIIFGQAKVALNQAGFGIETALPSVVTGKEHSVLNMSRGPVVVVPFSTDIGDFFVEVCLSQ